ncbi:MAG: hypothetical protein ABSB67_01850 [Bryobacteraceae bacterium]|jgi:hypothetical protein
MKPGEETQTSGSVPSAHGEDRLLSRYWGWFLVVVLLVFEYGLFRQYVLREIAWAYPASFDQATYLFQAYGDYERILSEGFLPGLKSSLLAQIPMGVMLQTQAALLFLTIGPTRLSALTLSFLYFALFQLLLVHTLRWLTGRWSLAFIGLGLFLVSTSRFFWAGGLADFRIDSIASSLYGITLCLAIRSRNFQSRPWSLVCGAFAALLILFRFIAITYLMGTLVCFFAYLAISALRRRRNDPWVVTRVKRQARGLMLAVLPIVGLVVPLLILSRQALYSYYVVGHLIGKEKEIRAAEFGAVGFFNYYLYYPVSLCRDHLGICFIVLVLLIAAAFAVCRFDGGRRALSDDRERRRELQDSLTLCLLAFLMPLALFTYDVAKSPVVAGMLVIPVVWVILLGGLWLSRFGSWGHPGRANQVALCVIAVLALLAGTWTEFAMNVRKFHTVNREQEQHLLEVYDRIGAYCAALGLETPRIAADRVLDYFSGSVVPVMVYERSKVLLRPEPTLGNGIFQVSHDDALNEVRASDIAILTTNSVPADEASPYPFTKSMIAIKADLLATATASMAPLTKLSFGGRDITIFVRSGARVEGDSGGWLTSAGATVIAPVITLRSHRYIVLQGRTIFPDQIGGRLRVSARLLSAAESQSLPTLVSPISASYKIVIDLRGQTLPSDGLVDIALSFDRYFVPKERGINSDDRQLVIMTPTDVTVTDQANPL